MYRVLTTGSLSLLFGLAFLHPLPAQSPSDEFSMMEEHQPVWSTPPTRIAPTAKKNEIQQIDFKEAIEVASQEVAAQPPATALPKKVITIEPVVIPDMYDAAMRKELSLPIPVTSSPPTQVAPKPQAQVGPKPQTEVASKPQAQVASKPQAQVASKTQAQVASNVTLGDSVTPTAHLERLIETHPDCHCEPSIEVPCNQCNESNPCIECEQSSPCNQCGNHNACQCNPRSAPECFSHVKNWWYGTDLYRLHVENLANPSMACVRPFGVCNESFAAAMIMAGKADRAMLHHYDFVQHNDGSIQLNEHGYRELERIVDLTNQFPLALTIESTNRPDQDEARRFAVISAITQHGLAIAPENVQIGRDRTVGLSGIDAQLIHAIRVSEAATGASRTRLYQNAAGASNIPFIGNAAAR